MEVADFSYLYSDQPQQEEDNNNSLLNKKTVTVAIVVVLFFSAIVFYPRLTANSNQKKDQGIVSEEKLTTLAFSTPTPAPPKIEGKIICLPDSKKNTANKECSIGFQTNDGTTYNLENVSLEKDKLTQGKVVTIQGTINSATGAAQQNSTKNSNSTNTTQTTNQVTLTGIVDLSSTSNNSVSPTTSQSGTSNIVVNSVVLPNSSGSGGASGTSATPTPEILYPTPTPQPPGNVSEIVQNSSNLEGQIVQVNGYLVNGNIGQEACIYLGLCEYSTLVIADTVSNDRDQQYDTSVRIRITEKEEDYTEGEPVNIQAKVLIINGEVVLEKVY